MAWSRPRLPLLRWLSVFVPGPLLRGRTSLVSSRALLVLCSISSSFSASAAAAADGVAAVSAGADSCDAVAAATAVVTVAGAVSAAAAGAIFSGDTVKRVAPLMHPALNRLLPLPWLLRPYRG